MKIAVIGTGYVGLVSGTCFAELGMDVACVDIDEAKIENLKLGKIPIYEPGLSELVGKNHSSGNLHFTTNLAEAVAGARAVFIAVGTPEDEKGRADLTYVFNVARSLAHCMDAGTVVVTKSTVPVGTNQKVAELLHSTNPNLVSYIASNPEFLREGSAIKDFLHPDRVVIGVEDAPAKQVMEMLYAPLAKQGVPIVTTDIASAELIKYASNAFLATKIGFINEIADICEIVQADIEDVAYGMGLDTRIGPKNLKPGPGFGGSCFPKDTLALTKVARDHSVPITVVEAVIESNARRKKRMAEKIIAACGGDVQGKKLAILGLAFKANTDDMRHAPALDIVPILHEAGAELHVYDPEAFPQAKQEMDLPNITWCNSKEEALDDAKAMVILTEWPEFKEMDLHQARTLLAEPRMIDLRNLFPADAIEAQGFSYISVGR